jgi:hypothetical protein
MKPSTSKPKCQPVGIRWIALLGISLFYGKVSLIDIPVTRRLLKLGWRAESANLENIAGVLCPVFRLRKLRGLLGYFTQQGFTCSSEICSVWIGDRRLCPDIEHNPSVLDSAVEVQSYRYGDNLEIVILGEIGGWRCFRWLHNILLPNGSDQRPLAEKESHE